VYLLGIDGDDGFAVVTGAIHRGDRDGVEGDVAPAKFAIWVAKPMTSQSSSIMTERSTASEILLNLLGEVSVPVDSTLFTKEAMYACWRTMRSKSLRGKP